MKSLPGIYLTNRTGRKLKIEHMKNKVLPTISFALILCLNTFVMINHICWMDEAQAWLIARDCKFTADSLFTITSYEGHPCLWFLVLMPFAKLGFPYFTLKVISLFFVSAALALILFKSPMPIWMRITCAFTPMFLVFYVVPARSYSMCGFLIIALAVTYKYRFDRPLLYGILLALLLQTLTIMAGFVFAACVGWLIETLISLKEKGQRYLLKQGAGLCIPFFSALFLLWEFRFTSALLESQGKESTSLGTKVLSFLKEGYWGFGRIYEIFTVPAIILMVILFMVCFMRGKRSVLPFAIVVVGILWQVFIYAFVFGNSNHRVLTWLYMFVWLVCALLSYEEIEKQPKKDKITHVFLISIAALFLLSLNYDRYEFLADLDPEFIYSDSLETAKAINSLPYDAVVIETNPDWNSAIIPYLDAQHSLYNPYTRKKGSFIDRNPNIAYEMSDEDFWKIIKEDYPDKKRIFVILVENLNKYGIEVFDKAKDGEIPNYQIIYKTSVQDCFRERYCLMQIPVQ